MLRRDVRVIDIGHYLHLDRKHRAILAYSTWRDRSDSLCEMPSPPLSIVQSLSPRVAVLTSDDVADSCAANGCHGLEELLRPWEGGTDRGECCCLGFGVQRIWQESAML